MAVGAGLCMYDVVVKKFTLAISSPDEFLLKKLQQVTLHLVHNFRPTMASTSQQDDQWRQLGGYGIN